MTTHSLTFKIVEEIGTFWVKCEEMKFSSYTKNPQKLVNELVEEWFNADMGDAFVPLD
jgi:hypothetical protein